MYEHLHNYGNILINVRTMCNCRNNCACCYYLLLYVRPLNLPGVWT